MNAKRKKNCFIKHQTAKMQIHVQHANTTTANTTNKLYKLQQYQQLHTNKALLTKPLSIWCYSSNISRSSSGLKWCWLDYFTIFIPERYIMSVLTCQLAEIHMCLII